MKGKEVTAYEEGIISYSFLTELGSFGLWGTGFGDGSPCALDWN